MKQLAVGFVIAGLFLAVLVFNLQWTVRNFAQLKPVAAGQPARGFALPILDGASVSLEELRGKTVVLSFWATWCPPCLRELPILEKLQREYGPKGVRFLAVNAQEEAAAVRDKVKQLGLTLTVLLDDGMVAALYGVQTLPSLVVIDRQGQVRKVHVGAADEGRLRQFIDEAQRY